MASRRGAGRLSAQAAAALMARALVLCCGLLLAAVATAQTRATRSVADAESTVRIGVLAFRPAEQTARQWAPTAATLEAAIPAYRFTVVPLTLETVDAAVDQRRVDFLLVNPEQYVILANRHHVRAVATLLPEIDGRPVSRFGGVIFARADRSDLTHLVDLRGRTVAAVSDKSFAGFLMQRWTLQTAGVDVRKDVARTILTGLPQDRVVEEVLAGRADVGFVRTGVLESMQREGKVAANALRIINRQPEYLHPQALSTGLYPEWPISALPHVPEALVKAVTLTLFRIEHDSPAARAGAYYGFAPPGDYASVEALLHRLHLHPDRPLDFGLSDVGRKYASTLTLGGTLALILALLLALYMHRQNLRLKAALADAERLALRDDLLTSLSEGVYGVDRDGRCTFVNPRALELLGFAADELIGKAQHAIFHHHFPDGRDYPVEACPVHRTLLDGQPRRTEETFFRKDGSELPVDMGTQPVHSGGRVVGAVVAFSDITERRANEEEIRRLALHDALTGLPNRRLLGDRLGVALAHAAREHTMAAVLFLDLDGFKSINDNHGHDAGDAVLIEVARRLEETVRGVDTVARFAGDEFVLVLADLQATADACRIADKLVCTLCNPIRVGEVDHRVTASIGIAMFPNDGTQADALLGIADGAMYVAKHEGKNCWRLGPCSHVEQAHA